MSSKYIDGTLTVYFDNPNGNLTVPGSLAVGFLSTTQTVSLSSLTINTSTIVATNIQTSNVSSLVENVSSIVANSVSSLALRSGNATTLSLSTSALSISTMAVAAGKFIVAGIRNDGFVTDGFLHYNTTTNEVVYNSVGGGGGGGPIFSASTIIGFNSLIAPTQFFAQELYTTNAYNFSQLGLTVSTAATSESWRGVAVSASGQYMLAATSTNLYSSSNFGFTWTQVATTEAWRNVAMSASGKIQYATIDNGIIYGSSDYGVTWTGFSTYSLLWTGITTSASGQYITCVELTDSQIWTSIDFGNSFQNNNPLLTGVWSSVQMSASGQIQTATINGGLVYGSTNYGQAWASVGLPSDSYTGVAMSASGQYQTVTSVTTGSGSGSIRTSSNFGANWTTFSIQAVDYTNVCMSASGQYQMVSINGGAIIQSSDYGSSWTSSNFPTGPIWTRIAMSAAGNYTVAVAPSNLINIASLPQIIPSLETSSLGVSSLTAYSVAPALATISTANISTANISTANVSTAQVLSLGVSSATISSIVANNVSSLTSQSGALTTSSIVGNNVSSLTSQSGALTVSSITAVSVAPAIASISTANISTANISTANISTLLANSINSSNVIATAFAVGYQYSWRAVNGTDLFSTNTVNSLAISSSAFTMECFYYPTATPPQPNIRYTTIMSLGAQPNTDGHEFRISGNANGGLGFVYPNGVGTTGVGCNIGFLTNSNWYHLALVRSGTNLTLYSNGSTFLTTSAVSYSQVEASKLILFSDQFNALSTVGYMNSARVVLGQALYTGNFNIPTQQLTTTSVGTTGANVAASLTGRVAFLGAVTSTIIDTSPSNLAVSAQNTATSALFSPYYSMNVLGSNVGINCNSPQYTLDVYGIANLSSAQIGSANVGTDTISTANISTANISTANISTIQVRGVSVSSATISSIVANNVSSLTSQSGALTVSSIVANNVSSLTSQSGALTVSSITANNTNTTVANISSLAVSSIGATRFSGAVNMVGLPADNVLMTTTSQQILLSNPNSTIMLYADAFQATPNRVRFFAYGNGTGANLTLNELGGNVGIGQGMINPQFTLDVVGTANFLSTLTRFANISSATISTIDNATNIQGNLNLPGGGTAFTIPTLGSGYRAFGLSGGNSYGFLYGAFQSLNDGIHLSYNYINCNLGNASNFIPNSGGRTSQITLGQGQILFNTSITSNTIPTERFRIAQDGNIGIGISVPQNTLDVNGITRISGPGQLWIGNISSGYTGNGSVLKFRTDTGANLSNATYQIEYNNGVSTGSNGLDIRFVGASDSGVQRHYDFGYYTSDIRSNAWNSAMKIASQSGRVGIGISTPQYLLDVNGTANLRGIRVVSNTQQSFLSSATSSIGLFVQAQDSPNICRILSYGNGGRPLYLNDSGGIVVIGTSSTIGGSFGLYVQGNVYASGVYSNSDQRVKEDIINANTTLCYSTMQGIDLKYFKWNSSFQTSCKLQETHQLGFIAQDVKKVFPNSVHISQMHGYDDFHAIDTGQINAVHFGATKKLMTVVEQQTAQLQHQSTQIANLLADNSTLTSMCAYIPQLMNTVSTLKG